jgi:hypothetical protein
MRHVGKISRKDLLIASQFSRGLIVESEAGEVDIVVPIHRGMGEFREAAMTALVISTAQPPAGDQKSRRELLLPFLSEGEYLMTIHIDWGGEDSYRTCTIVEQTPSPELRPSVVYVSHYNVDHMFDSLPLKEDPSEKIKMLIATVQTQQTRADEDHDGANARDPEARRSSQSCCAIA